MPYVYTPPAVFMEHGGIKIYHAYDDDELFYWYTTDETERTVFEFDIRDVQQHTDMKHDLQILRLDDRENHKRLLTFAIDHGLLNYPTDNEERHE